MVDKGRGKKQSDMRNIFTEKHSVPHEKRSFIFSERHTAECCSPRKTQFRSFNSSSIGTKKIFLVGNIVRGNLYYKDVFCGLYSESCFCLFSSWPFFGCFFPNIDGGKSDAPLLPKKRGKSEFFFAQRWAKLIYVQ